MSWHISLYRYIMAALKYTDNTKPQIPLLYFQILAVLFGNNSVQYLEYAVCTVVWEIFIWDYCKKFLWLAKAMKCYIFHHHSKDSLRTLIFTCNISFTLIFCYFKLLLLLKLLGIFIVFFIKDQMTSLLILSMNLRQELDINAGIFLGGKGGIFPLLKMVLPPPGLCLNDKNNFKI